MCAWGLSGPAGCGCCTLFLLRSPVNVALSGPAGCGCGTLFLLRGSPPACKKQTAAPAPLRLSRPLDAPQLRSPARVGGRTYRLHLDPLCDGEGFTCGVQLPQRSFGKHHQSARLPLHLQSAELLIHVFPASLYALHLTPALLPDNVVFHQFQAPILLHNNRSRQYNVQ